jgi:hypothetical protein
MSETSICRLPLMKVTSAHEESKPDLPAAREANQLGTRTFASNSICPRVAATSRAKRR